MAPKFDLQTADVPALRDRVRQLTSAIVKQKEQIEQLRAKEHHLAGEKEKLERVQRDLQEEAAMAREMRADLQGQVARLQRALEHQAAEAELLRTEAQRAPAHDSAGAADQNEGEMAALRMASHNAEARASSLESELARQRQASRALSDELDALKDTFDLERQRWAAAAASHRLLPAGPSPAHTPHKSDGGGDESVEAKSVGAVGGWMDEGLSVASDHPPPGGGDGEGREGGDGERREVVSHAHTNDNQDTGETGAGDVTALPPGSAQGAHGGGHVDWMQSKVEAERSKRRELEAAVSQLHQQLALQTAQHEQEVQGHVAAQREAGTRHSEALASLEQARLTHKQAQAYIKELEAQRDEHREEMERARAAAKERELHAQDAGHAAEQTASAAAEARARIVELEEELGRERWRAREALAQATRAEAALGSAEAAAGQQAAAFESERKRMLEAGRRAEEQEAAALRDAEACKRACAEEKARSEAVQAEAERQLAMDKSIVKGLRAEINAVRQRATEAEAALLAARKMGEDAAVPAESVPLDSRAESSLSDGHRVDGTAGTEVTEHGVPEEVLDRCASAIGPGACVDLQAVPLSEETGAGDGRLLQSSNDVASLEGGVSSALMAVEDLIEAMSSMGGHGLSSAPGSTGGGADTLDAKLAVLEQELSRDPPATAIARQVKALEALAQIANDHLQAHLETIGGGVASTGAEVGDSLYVHMSGVGRHSAGLVRLVCLELISAARTMRECLGSRAFARSAANDGGDGWERSRSGYAPVIMNPVE